ncbi:MAG: hypothetical protein M3323_11475 [Actinomycetota bacterium]|nr:hypothetical protein [Actinomycetota bacterium]
MSKRAIAVPVLLAVVGAVLAAATAARAETCVELPGTTGATIIVAGQEIRVPSTSGVAVCVEPGGLPGLPRVDSSSSATTIVLEGGSGASGYVAVRYTLDGSPNQISVPIPGGGGGSERCLASVGEWPRTDCLASVKIDDIPDPGPLPTLPPVSPEPLPTVSPEPICTKPTGCVPGDPIDPIALVQWVCGRFPELLAC